MLLAAEHCSLDRKRKSRSSSFLELEIFFCTPTIFVSELHWIRHREIRQLDDQRNLASSGLFCSSSRSGNLRRNSHRTDPSSAGICQCTALQMTSLVKLHPSTLTQENVPNVHDFMPSDISQPMDNTCNLCCKTFATKLTLQRAGISG